jgi:hypothetical protein
LGAASSTASVVGVRHTGTLGAVALLAVVACSGRISGSGAVGTGGRVAGGAGTGGLGTAGAGVQALDCQTATAPVLHTRLLAPSQYDNTISDLVKVGGNPSKNFSAGIDAQLDDSNVELRADAAAGIAAQAAATLAQWTPCPSPTAADAACEGLIIDRVGAQAYRHPLSPSERAELKTLFDAGITEKDFTTGLQWFLAGLFQSPDFLYQLSRHQDGEAAGEVRALLPYEVASRLSYFVWDSPPDDALYAAAAGSKLGDAAAVRAQVTRLIQDARFARGLAGFYGSWLRLGGFAEVARDDPAFTSDVVSALQTSLLMSATQLYAGGGTANITGLFTGQSYYLNGPLRKFYGLPGDTTDMTFTATDMPGEDRVGIVTHPALAAMLARPAESNPISRGLFVRRSLLCQNLPPPPTNIVIPQLAPVSAMLSTRDRLDQHAKVALCASCHNLMDPPGYALESFDQVGRHRTADGGKAIDTSGDMVAAGDVTGPFATGAELLGRLAQSHDIRACFAQKYFEYAAAHAAAAEDQCSISALQTTFIPSGDLRELVAGIAASDSFRLRLSEGGAP